MVTELFILLLLVLKDGHFEVLLENRDLVPDLLFELLVLILVVLPSHHFIVFSIEIESTI